MFRLTKTTKKYFLSLMVMISVLVWFEWNSGHSHHWIGLVVLTSMWCGHCLGKWLSQSKRRRKV